MLRRVDSMTQGVLSASASVMQSRYPITIHVYAPSDLDAVIDIFLAAIREVASKDYSPAAVEAWAQVDREGWDRARNSRPTWIAKVGSEIVGFTDLEPDGHLDTMFVHPAHQGKGVAHSLFDTVETAARDLGLKVIFTEASITARPFFESCGFTVLASQLVEKRGQHLRNYRMAKVLL